MTPGLVTVWIRHRDGGYRWTPCAWDLTRAAAGAFVASRYTERWVADGGGVVVLPAGERPDIVASRRV